MLLALEAAAVARTPEAENALRRSLPEVRVRGVFRGHGDDVRTAVLTPDGERVVTASSDGTARIWDAASGRPLAVLAGHRAGVVAAKVSPAGDAVLTFAHDGTRASGIRARARSSA